MLTSLMRSGLFLTVAEGRPRNRDGEKQVWLANTKRAGTCRMILQANIRKCLEIHSSWQVVEFSGSRPT